MPDVSPPLSGHLSLPEKQSSPFQKFSEWSAICLVIPPGTSPPFPPMKNIPSPVMILFSQRVLAKISQDKKPLPPQNLPRGGISNTCPLFLLREKKFEFDRRLTHNHSPLGKTTPPHNVLLLKRDFSKKFFPPRSSHAFPFQVPLPSKGSPPPAKFAFFKLTPLPKILRSSLFPKINFFLSKSHPFPIYSAPAPSSRHLKKDPSASARQPLSPFTRDKSPRTPKILPATLLQRPSFKKRRCFPAHVRKTSFFFKSPENWEGLPF